jgi:hypothetical protein
MCTFSQRLGAAGAGLAAGSIEELTWLLVFSWLHDATTRRHLDPPPLQRRLSRQLGPGELSVP